MKIVLSNKYLFEACTPINDLKDCFLKALEIKKWLKNKSNAFAVSANQIGFKERFFVVRKPNKARLNDFLIIDPYWEPLSSSAEIESEEGCLSFPGKIFIIKRCSQIEVTYYSYYDKKLVKKELSGIEAIGFQHETDHLDGISCSENEEKKEDASS